MHFFYLPPLIIKVPHSLASIWPIVKKKLPLDAWQNKYFIYMETIS